MIIRIFIGGLFVICGTAVGMVKARRLLEREEMLRQLIQGLEYLKNEIYYTRERLHEVAWHVSEMSEGYGADFFRHFADNLAGNEEAGTQKVWNDSVDAVFPYFCALDEKDTDALKALGSRLGRTDVAGQCENIQRTMKELAIRKAEAGAQTEKKSRLYKTLGMAAGAAAAVFII